MKLSTPQSLDYVTQSQWAEGMEMIKDFFGKLTTTIEDVAIELREFRSEQQQVNTEQRQTNKEMQNNIEMNTNALGSLTQEVREIKKFEFEIYDHEKRITKLEKTRV